MLTFYETFQKYLLPENLKDEIYNVDELKLDTLETFSKINVFIGPNNSGKSKLIRELIKRKPDPAYGKKNWDTITELIRKIFFIAETKLKNVFAASNHFIISNSGNGEILNTEELFKTKERSLEYSFNYDLTSIINRLEFHFIQLPNNIIRDTSFYVRQTNSSTLTFDLNQRERFLANFDEIKEQVTPIIKELKRYIFSSLEKTDISHIYIPSLRTLRSFASGANIKNLTKDEYQFDNKIIIYNGQDIPSEIDDLTNSEYINTLKLHQFQEFLSKEFFESKTVKLTYHRKRNVLLIKIGEEIEKPIHEMGDGLQMIIILTLPFFTYNCGLVAIEEPELFLHPGLQKAFVKFLITHPKTENFQIFLATHSNHIIDSINQSDLVSLFSIKKKEKTNDNSIEKIPDFIIDNLAFGNENFLNLLGITTTSVYLSNCTIWVEGITDKLYIQKFIFEYLKSVDQTSKYFKCKEYKEGINYSFALTAGDSIIHWDFSDENEYYENTKNIIVRKFCSKSLVVVDNDFGKNVERKKILGELLKNRFVELEYPEIENLLASTVINKTLLTYPSVNKAVGNNKLPIVEIKEFQTKKIGFIIDELILKKYPSSKNFSSSEKQKSSLKSGDKFIFCNKALGYISHENLTTESILLVEKILDFVISKNYFL